MIESARVGTDALRANPLRTVLSTTGVIIGLAALVAAFAITDGVEVWSRDMLARELSVQDVAITPVTIEVVNGHRLAGELSGERDPLWLIGRTVRLAGQQREVIGVLAAPTGGPEPDLVAFAPIQGSSEVIGPSSTQGAEHRGG